MLIREYLSHRHGPIHISRTLDQFYYNSIGTDTRDLDQVVYRFSQMVRTPEVLEAYEKRIEFETSCTLSGPKDRAFMSNPTRNSPVVGGGVSQRAEEKAEELKDGEREVPTDTGNPRIFTVDQM